MANRETPGTSPEMTMIGGRPAKVQQRLVSIDRTWVQCRLASGEDVFVPMREIYQMFEAEFKMRHQAILDL